MSYADTVSTYTGVAALVRCCHTHQQPVYLPLSKSAKFLNRINHLLPCKATWMAIKDGKIIAWHDGPHWLITRSLELTNTKADFSGLVQRRGCAPAGGPWCTVHREKGKQ